MHRAAQRFILIPNLYLLKTLAFGSYMIFFMSCAAVQSPPGGPKDETPPELIETIPADGTVLFEGGRIELIFSEYVDANTVEKAIRILPTMDPPPEIIYKGRRVYVEMPDSLADNQTYIISIDRTFKDEHKVPLAQGIQVAFATGDKIDEGRISGTITYKKDAAVQLWKIQDETDFTQFYQRVPDYVVDASDSGHYEFRFLSDGNYRLAAVDRSASGIPIVPERMIYGLPWNPIIQLGNEKEKTNQNIRIPDIMGGIKMIQGEWQTGNWATLTFSDKINDWESMVQIQAVSDDSSIVIPETFLDPLDETKLHVTLPEFNESKYITFLTNGLRQGEESIIDSGMIKVKVDTSQDTTHLLIRAPKKNFVLPIDEEKIESIQCVFSNLIDIEKTQNPFSIVQDSIPISFKSSWESMNHVHLTTEENWLPKTGYTLQILRDEIQPLYGQLLKDSVKVISFKTSEFQGFGRLIGSTINNGMEPMVAEVTSMEKEPSTFRTVVNLDGIFEMNRLPEGNYSLLFFQDSDGNNRYSHGIVQPYTPSEWFYEYIDTVKIRTNWDLELHQINLEQTP